VVVPVLARKRRAARPQDAETETPQPELSPRCDDDHRDLPPRGLGERGFGVGARRRRPGVEHGVHAQAGEDVGGAADVVAIRVREHEQRKAPEPEPVQLPPDLRLGRALVHEHRVLARLE
jgi:hypothetical protein